MSSRHSCWSFGSSERTWHPSHAHKHWDPRQKRFRENSRTVRAGRALWRPTWSRRVWNTSTSSLGRIPGPITLHGQFLLPMWTRNSWCSVHAHCSLSWHHPLAIAVCTIPVGHWGHFRARTPHGTCSSPPPQLPQLTNTSTTSVQGGLTYPHSPQGRNFRSHMKAQLKSMCKKQSLCRKRAPGSCWHHLHCHQGPWDHSFNTSTYFFQKKEIWSFCYSSS